MLRVQGLNAYYGESHILHDLSLEVEKGKVAALLGRNGMGKTTIIHSIMGLVPKREGTITVDGKNVINRQSHHISKAGVGLVPQGRRIFPNLTVKENLLTTYVKIDKEGWTLEKIYQLFPRLKERQHFMGGSLSGGEQQMLSIGRALLTNPSLLLLDEPSEGLSPLMVEEVSKIIHQLKKEGLTMLLVEQNLAMAKEIADYVYIVNKGQVTFEGPSDSFNEDVQQEHLALSS
ncbi:amino acid/amide ABC transporter ATP-binding protein 2, HAAT family [Alteribacillus persepolensis]|uniref:Amino acid/amide ABC transporter ATP-binding protein 2, HAAT family n=1 Tax=Alteribacillus persepolensis TaxID=568899 RepID=A0A1G8GG26_9BACI|nr:ABC transporter ATP-binding protein [Alteribacillus persepolensis]SDH93296.1 amino acid/amide ABC transporter ATP-binding protein 2, HAAT family [Alteribacillus persepolensis]